jgi:hypothetical protein
MELTMNTRSIKTAAVAAALAGAPMLGMAANSQVALDSCAKAFMTELSTSKPGAFKLSHARYEADGGVADGDILALGGNAEMTLTARDAHDNHAVARAVCTVNSRGEVVNLQPAPLSALEPY